MTRRHHLASLDAFRGITVAGMILVNNPGSWNNVFEPLTHADWNGCTFADVVFPFFIFILGAAMPFAFNRRTEQGVQTHELYARIARRTTWLIALGLVLNVVAAIPSVSPIRFPGVLQRIGLVYLVAALVVLHVRPAWRGAIAVALVLGHWALLTLVPFGGTAPGLTQLHNLAGFVDHTVLGRHALTAAGDPEGILATIPAVSTALIGSLAGEWLRRRHMAMASPRFFYLVAGASALFLVGFIWSFKLPLNKSLWTGSFVLCTAGMATLILAACYLLVDVYEYRAWASPFLWLGFNPLAIYFCSEFVSHLFDKPWLRVDGQTLTVRSWLFWDVLRPITPAIGDEWLSMTLAVVTASLWAAVAGLLYARNVRLHV